MPDQVPEAVKRARSRELHALGIRLKQALLARNVGRSVRLLMEGVGCDDAGEFHACYTPNYLPVRLRNANTTGLDRMLSARLTGITDDGEALNAAPVTRHRSAGTDPQ